LTGLVTLPVTLGISAVFIPVIIMVGISTVLLNVFVAIIISMVLMFLFGAVLTLISGPVYSFTMIYWTNVYLELK
jgi:VIT1/CCC1 family predicted Fe2+/Mn2+ transporter